MLLRLVLCATHLCFHLASRVNCLRSSVEATTNISTTSVAETHTSGLRRLADLIPPGPMFLSDGTELDFLSVVPTFGAKGESYIALLLKYDDKLWHALKEPESEAPDSAHAELPRRIMCSGANRSHRTEMLLLGGETQAANKSHLVFICGWPTEEASVGCYDIFLEESIALDGEVGVRDLGHLRSCHDPQLLGTYSTAACVTSVWDNLEDHKSIALLPQWLEFHFMQGVEHFLVYTLPDTDTRVLDAYKPYVMAGLATQVNIGIPEMLRDFYIDKGHSTQGWLANDCLYRMKHHTKWLLPTIGVDEYIRTSTSPNNLSWDDIEAEWEASQPWYLQWTKQRKLSNSTKRSVHAGGVHSISFGQYTFRHPTGHALQISSIRREPLLAKRYPKYAVKPSLVNVLYIHWPTSWMDDSVMLGVPPEGAVVHHYRTDDRSNTTVDDHSLAVFAATLQVAIETRYQSTWLELEANLSSPQRSTETHPPSELKRSDSSNEEVDEGKAIASWVQNFSELQRTQIISPPSTSDSYTA